MPEERVNGYYWVRDRQSWYDKTVPGPACLGQWMDGVWFYFGVEGAFDDQNVEVLSGPIEPPS